MSYSLSRISTISQAHLKAATAVNSEIAWARQRLLEMSEANLTRLELGGPIAMAHYLTAASLRPKLSKVLQRRLQQLPYLTISAVCVDCSSPPQQHLLKLKLPNSITVAAAIKEIIDEQTRLVQGDVMCVDAYPASQYLLKVCCSQVGVENLPIHPSITNPNFSSNLFYLQEYLFELDSCLVHYTYVQECLQRGDIPRLTPVLLNDVLECLGLPTPEKVQSYTDYMTSNRFTPDPANFTPSLPSVMDLYGVDEKEADEMDLWDLRDYFSLTVRSAQKVGTTVTQASSLVGLL